MDIQWKDEFALGIGIIDDQHKKLIERAASFSRAVLTSPDLNRKALQTLDSMSHVGTTQPLFSIR